MRRGGSGSWAQTVLAAHEVPAAGGGVGVPTWMSDHEIAFTTADGRLQVIDLTTGKVRLLATLAERPEMPPAQVYDPSDANGELQWTDLFAVAPRCDPRGRPRPPHEPDHLGNDDPAGRR